MRIAENKRKSTSEIYGATGGLRVRPRPTIPIEQIIIFEAFDKNGRLRVPYCFLCERCTSKAAADAFPPKYQVTCPHYRGRIRAKPTCFVLAFPYSEFSNLVKKHPAKEDYIKKKFREIRDRIHAFEKSAIIPDRLFKEMTRSAEVALEQMRLSTKPGPVGGVSKAIDKLDLKNGTTN